MNFLGFMEEIDSYFPIFEKILEKHIKQQKTGRPREDAKKIFRTVMYVDKTGIQWQMIPPCEYLADASTAHENYQLWVKLGLIDEFFATSQKIYSKHVGYKTRWSSVDCTIVQSRVIALPLGQEDTGKNPTDRGRPGSKISVMVDQTGATMGFTIGAANIHDSKFLPETLIQGSLLSLLDEANIDKKKNLCLDKGYDGNASEECAYVNGFESHIRTRGEEKVEKKNGKKAKRYVVEASFAWDKSFRHIRTRFTKYSKNFKGLFSLVCARVLLRRVWAAIGGPITPDMIPDVDMAEWQKWVQAQRAYAL